LPLLELLLLLEEPFDVLDVLEEVAADWVAVVAADVTPLFAAQKDVYHDWMACKSAVAVQLPGVLGQTPLTQAVPDSVIAVSRGSEQKQLSLIVVICGGEHAP